MNFLRHGLNLLRNKNNNNYNEEDLSEEDRLEMERKAREGESSFTPFKKILKAEGSKALIKFLLGSHIIMIFGIVLLIVIIFVVIVVVLAGSESLDVPKSSTLSSTYASNSNVSVTIIKSDDDESNSSASLGLEDYVKKVLMFYGSNLDLDDKEAFNAYYATAISVRTEAVRNNYKVTFYGDLNSGNKLTSAMSDALEESKGIIMVDGTYDSSSDKSLPFIKANNTFFNWDTVKEGYHVSDAGGFEIPSEYISDHVSSNLYKECPANFDGDYVEGEFSEDCWEEKEIEHDVTGPDGKTTTETEIEYYWKHKENTSTPSFSVLGALYLSREYGYNYGTLLKNFYGEDIQLIKGEDKKDSTTSKTSSSNTCEAFDLHTTDLSEEEFVSLASKELEKRLATETDKNGIRKYLLSGDVLSQMYKQSVENNWNPEFTFVKAIAENSPGGERHNYWGYDCPNTSSCGKNSWFTAGQEFAEYAQRMSKKYNTFDDVIKSYAYLGDYWYNPGGSGLGGCYYAKYIYPDGIPDRVAQACASGNNCSKAGKESGCVKTTDEDKEMYQLYQKRILYKIRKSIFGIDSEGSGNCSNKKGTCTLYKQNDSSWATDTLGNGSDTIGKSGCTLTSIAMAMTCSGKVDSSTFNPATLNNLLKQGEASTSGFSGSLISWNNLNNSLEQLAPGFGYVNTYTVSTADTVDGTRKELIDAFSNTTYKHIVLVALLRSKQHWVLIPEAPSANDTQVTVYDPETGSSRKMDVTSFKNLEIFGWND